MSEETKWIYLPINLTDWGSIEAWLNKKAQQGWHFSEKRFISIVKMTYRPTEKNIVYRLKNSKADTATMNLRKKAGWHSTYDAPGSGCRLWWKETEDPLEYCPDAYTERREYVKRIRWGLIAEILFVLSLLPDSVKSFMLSGGSYYILLAEFVCSLLLLIKELLQWRNIQNSEYIGWPSIILTTIIGKMFWIVLVGLVMVLLCT